VGACGELPPSAILFRKNLNFIYGAFGSGHDLKGLIHLNVLAHDGVAFQLWVPKISHHNFSCN